MPKVGWGEGKEEDELAVKRHKNHCSDGTIPCLD